MSHKIFSSPVVSSVRMERSILSIARKLDIGIGEIFLTGLRAEIENGIKSGKYSQDLLDEFNIAYESVENNRALKWNLENGFRKSPEYRMWAGAVKFRDGMKCVICGSDVRLEAHHIVSIQDRPDLKLSLENGIALCKKCHKKAHLEAPLYSEQEFKRLVCGGELV